MLMTPRTRKILIMAADSWIRHLIICFIGTRYSLHSSYILNIAFCFLVPWDRGLINQTILFALFISTFSLRKWKCLRGRVITYLLDFVWLVLHLRLHALFFNFKCKNISSNIFYEWQTVVFITIKSIVFAMIPLALCVWL